MITVFGSINVDLVMRVERLPRPGETVPAEGHRLLPGGKGANQALAAARAGARVAAFGCIGEDRLAGVALAELERSSVDLSGVTRVEAPTGCAAVWVDARGGNMIVVASGANGHAHARQVPNERLGGDAMLLLQMEVPPAENERLVLRAHEGGARILLNCAPVRPISEDVLERLDYLVVNESEAAELGRALGLARTSAGTVAEELARRFGLTCVVTRGDAGAIAVAADGSRFAVSTLAVEPVDTTGAGDAFVGVLAAALDEGRSLEVALRRAAAAGALACTGEGAQASLPDAKTIEEAARHLAVVPG